MITETDVLLLHELSIIDFGGKEGVRDEGALLSAIARPYQTFDGKELYPTAYEKAASLAESIVVNHPFFDGNKRTGLLAILALLMEYSIDVIANDEDLYNFIVRISTGENRYDAIVSWLKNNSKTVD